LWALVRTHGERLVRAESLGGPSIEKPSSSHRTAFATRMLETTRPRAWAANRPDAHCAPLYILMFRKHSCLFPLPCTSEWAETARGNLRCSIADLIGADPSRAGPSIAEPTVDVREPQARIDRSGSLRRGRLPGHGSIIVELRRSKEGARPMSGLAHRLCSLPAGHRKANPWCK